MSFRRVYEEERSYPYHSILIAAVRKMLNVQSTRHGKAVLETLDLSMKYVEGRHVDRIRLIHSFLLDLLITKGRLRIRRSVDSDRLLGVSNKTSVLLCIQPLHVIITLLARSLHHRPHETQVRG